MRQKFVVGNWKMHTTTAEATRLAKAIVDGVGTMRGSRIRRRLSALPLSGPCRGDSQGQPRRARGAEPLSREGRRVHRRGQPDDAPRSRLQVRHPRTQRAPAQLGESDAFINQKVRLPWPPAST
jgi:triosephosphate isomerase